jgi:hypothetical protein
MRSMYKLSGITRQFGFAALLLLASAAAIPQQAGTRFTVEIVVFRTASQAGALTAAATPTAGDDVEPTAVATRKLGGAADKLRRTAGYKVLAHTAWTQGPAGFNSRRGVSAARLGLERAGITGKVILERGQYVHMGVDLTIDDGGRRYHISEVRRIKPDEVQYFDHPAVGVIALVTAGS